MLYEILLYAAMCIGADGLHDIEALHTPSALAKTELEELAAGTELSQENEKSMNVLIVEDNAGIRRVIQRTLLGTASSIWECCDGSEALLAYATQRPDVVSMDIQMPRLDGLTATRRIRALDPHARVLVLTDHDDDDLRRAAVEAGAFEVSAEAGPVPMPWSRRFCGAAAFPEQVAFAND